MATSSAHPMDIGVMGLHLPHTGIVMACGKTSATDFATNVVTCSVRSTVSICYLRYEMLGRRGGLTGRRDLCSSRYALRHVYKKTRILRIHLPTRNLPTILCILQMSQNLTCSIGFQNSLLLPAHPPVASRHSPVDEKLQLSAVYPKGSHWEWSVIRAFDMAESCYIYVSSEFGMRCFSIMIARGQRGPHEYARRTGPDKHKMDDESHGVTHSMILLGAWMIWLDGRIQRLAAQDAARDVTPVPKTSTS
ncbi:hypothetical protein Cob_v012092 [Colletotrichum orbiculare MAFF 240422]|uniref:Uncharacterized protein n=1 Tax=Colletotrichum orbiculare (strain 104-T / ATCC 96160 / CBS 514.97 / LARS 414 / MAFF 240422) TaxID=1213857 RepID=A0A484FAE5_COLOR|nr:hypothetical protein Cob_v012092 [Colletotrichum orbiculare MAFF 240422]